MAAVCPVGFDVTKLKDEVRALGREYLQVLDAYAAGWADQLKLHHRWITYQGRTWVEFPKGAGTGGRDYQVSAWQVRRMTANLFISMKCAKEHLPALGPVKHTDS